jgi:pimeloyl-ACP methyl ester carboxylesterase
LRVHHAGVGPTLIHLPGLHGDWTLLRPFRRELAGRACLVEVTYPRRTDWRLPDYVAALEEALRAEGLGEAWLLAESFSSQVGWQFVAGQEARRGFQLHGMILVGGFIRHSWPWGVHLTRMASGAVPGPLLRLLCEAYGRPYAAADPAMAPDLAEFVRRRTDPIDRAAITRRYRLIAEADLRPVARAARLPVYQLSGAVDPLVPWPLVRSWLRQHCPGYRASRILRRGGHNILLGNPQESVRQILEWTAA